MLIEAEILSAANLLDEETVAPIINPEFEDHLMEAYDE